MGGTTPKGHSPGSWETHGAMGAHMYKLRGLIPHSLALDGNRHPLQPAVSFGTSLPTLGCQGNTDSNLIEPFPWRA